MRFESLQQAIGNTPLVRLNKIAAGLKPNIYAKLEYLNPGGSIKDRIGISMIEAAEREGKLKPGGVVIECTSGNTGMGLAIAAKIKGYKCIFTLSDKQSKEKIDMLKALGAEAIVCPTAVSHSDPRHFIQVAKRLNKEIPNSILANQYDNPANWQAHYKTLAPELWKETEGKVTHIVCGMGTCGTITGIGKYIKEQKSSVKMIGIDPIGSILYHFFKTGKVIEGTTYKVEGIGEDFFPKIIDWNVIDDIIQVTDRESFLTARKLAKDEGIFAGGSSGSAVAGALRLASQLDESSVIVVILPDSGMRYLGKIFDDSWMRTNQYFESPITVRVDQAFTHKLNESIMTIKLTEKCSTALSYMREHEFSQLPIAENDAIIGTIYEDQIITEALKGRDLKQLNVSELMQPALPILPVNTPLIELLNYIPAKAPAVFIKSNNNYCIVTKYDLLKVIGDMENAY